MIDADLHSLTYRGADSPALSDLRLRVGPGESVLLTGPSGGGKSTLVRALNGLVPHVHPADRVGRLRVAGLDPQEAALHETGRRAATVFQNPRTQFFTTDAVSEMAFALENAGRPPEEIRARVATAVRDLGIETLLGRPLARLSGGQQQLVACAAAAAARPDVVLLDEPTANLAPSGVAAVARAVRHLRGAGVATVVCEHRSSFLAGLVDRVLVIDQGTIVAAYTGAEFYRLPPHRIAALGLRATAARHLRAPDVIVNGGRATPAPHGPGLTVTDLRVAHGRRRVLDIDRLHLPAGRVTALVGPNGSGKTTLLNALCGLLRTHGDIALDGQPLSRAQRRRAGYVVFQDVNRQLAAATVLAEVAVGLPRRADPRLARHLLRVHDLDALADRHPMALSGGEKQRLVIAAAQACDKRVYLFDEPSSGLDAARLRALAATLRGLAERGRVVVVVTHDPELIDACADQVVLIDTLDPVPPSTAEEHRVRTSPDHDRS